MGFIMETVHLKFNVKFPKHMLVWKILGTLKRGYKVSLVVNAVYEYCKRRNFRLSLEDLLKSAEETEDSDIVGFEIKIQAAVEKRSYLLPANVASSDVVSVQAETLKDCPPALPETEVDDPLEHENTPTMIEQKDKARAAMLANIDMFNDDED